jgi:para-nitrobenzyl esterase
MHKLLPVFVFAVFACFQNVNAQCSNGRYYNKIFGQNMTTVTFGNGMKFDSTFVDLKMDVYQPTGDNFARRPTIVFAFPGSFTAGTRLSPDIITMCDNFARRGYVCVSIDYRLGFEGGSDSDTNQFKALMRGVQDMKAAVRYLYKDAQTTNTFRIDTNQIFIGGSSAGAFIALNYAYGKEDTLSRSEPAWARPALDSLGGPEGNSGNPGYSSKVKGVVNLCGGIADTVWIMPGDPIMVGVHGTDDSTVTCYFDSVYASTHPECLLFGGGDIMNRMTHIGANFSMYLFQGADHVPYVLPIPFIPPASTYMDSTVWIVRDFLYQNVECDSTLMISGVEDLVSGFPVSVFPNPSDDNIQVYSYSATDYKLEVFSTTGEMLLSEKLSAYSSYTLYKSQYSAGMYVVRLTDANGATNTQRIVFH